MKKRDPWHELIEHVPEINRSMPGVLIDVGGGNGRNIQNSNWTLVVCLDLTPELLHNYVGASSHQLVEGSLPRLPFRTGVAELAISIAVIHHLRPRSVRMLAVGELVRIVSSGGEVIFTVWRKWRPSHAKLLVQRIREGSDVEDLVDHMRPWKNSEGEILGYRYYHYYTMREIVEELANFHVSSLTVMGGRSKKDNFLVRIEKTGNIR